METPSKLSFDQIYQLFARQALRVYKAEYLLLLGNEYGISNDELIEIEKEYDVAQEGADLYFDMMIEMGIPASMLTKHLRVTIPAHSTID